MKPELKKQILSDRCRVCTEENFIKLIKIKMTHPSLKYLKIYRKAKYYSDKGGSVNKILSVWYSYLLFNYSVKFGYQINRNCTVGLGLYLGHRGSIVVNGQAVLGNNVNLANGVTIGATPRGERKGVPKIGDNVWIGANAVIVGNVTIGSDVLIAPNSFVNFDVPCHSIVIGSPGKIISRENATDGYIQNPYPLQSGGINDKNSHNRNNG